ncbi:UbiA prenyltransferase [Delitschia confertaspora ATCC 74209]|uniref:4-hydroxybenzoate polyprenyltransferase, mitochondrial n=1 Tax=Delitschia confertaspora ATCC 74209 TaxID=1513339 RepID=A0A9P4JF54_9PLEO|nr:UbiA prenyltransferase [Delitschia confertaspora ATCC 74209]
MTNGTRRKQDELPAYVPPKVGILSRIPASWVPYGELMRIDKPTGIFLFYFPHLFGTLYAGLLPGSSQGSPMDLLFTNGILFFGTVFSRAAACAWNDILDREYDRQVLRCRLRPLARGAISLTQALGFTFFMTIVCVGFISALPLDFAKAAFPSITLLVLYPLAKRFTDFPQLVLGIQIALSFFLGIIATGYDFSTFFERTNATQRNSSLIAMIFFYAANVCWTVVYDTVYAQQDVKDDAKAGVKSMAVRYRNNARGLLVAVALLQVGFLAATGFYESLGISYFSLSCGGTTSAMVWMILTLDLNSPAECMWWFKNGCWLVGLSITGGLGYANLLASGRRS